jgi:hypothetical protein
MTFEPDIIRDRCGILGELPHEIDEALHIKGSYEIDELECLLHTAKIAGGWGNFLEIGVWCGRSATAIAHAFRRYTVGSYKFYLVDNSSRHPSQDELRWPRWKRLIEHIKDGKRPNIKNISFFHLDAEHTVAAVHNDLVRYLPNMKVGGFLALHDYHGIPNVQRGCEKAFNALGKKATFVPWRTAVSTQVFRRVE